MNPECENECDALTNETNDEVKMIDDMLDIGNYSNLIN